MGQHNTICVEFIRSVLLPQPPAVDSSRALADLEEVKAIGGSKSVADRRTKRDRPLLVRKFAPGLEPDRTRSVGDAAIRRVGERPTVRTGKSRDGRRLHRRFRKQISF